MATTFPISPSTGQKFTNGNKVWTWDGNSWKGGVTSGGDAGTLDGVSSASFVRSDTNDSFSGTLSGAGSINITGTVTAASFTGSGAGDSTKLPLAGGTMTGDVNLGDNVKANFGAGSDLQIYHVANTGNRIIGSGTYGDIKIQSHAISIVDNGSNVMADFSTSGSSSRLFNGADGLKLATTTTGIDVTGNLTVSGGIKLGDDNRSASTAGAGALKWNVATNTLQNSDGTNWTDVSMSPLGSELNPASSALAIIAAGTSTGNGLYWLTNPNVNGGAGFEVYCDMTKDGGGWILVHTVRGDNIAYMDWTTSNIGLRNQTSPAINNTYSILSWSDQLKKSGAWQWMIEATDTVNTRYTWGGIFTANVNSYSLVANVPTQTNVTANEFFNITSFADSSGHGGRVPWVNTGNYAPTDALFTTYPGSSSWWGTITQSNSNFSSYYSGPWISGPFQAPLWKRVWIR